MALELGPDGTQFDVPVTLTLDVPGPPSTVTLTHISGDSAPELIEALPIAYDPDSDVTTMSAEVPHFSRLFITRWDETLALLLPNGLPDESITVGTTFVVHVEADITYVERVVKLKGGGVETFVPQKGAAWYLEYSAWVSSAALPISGLPGLSGQGVPIVPDGESPLEPWRIPLTDLVVEANVPAGQTSTDIRMSFTCARPGKFTFVLAAVAYVPHDNIYEEPNQPPRRSEGLVGAREELIFEGECVAAPDDAPTPTPTSFMDPGTPGATTIVGEGQPPLEEAPPPPTGTPVAARPNEEPPTGMILAIPFDGTWYYADSLVITAAHGEFCTYEHLHGGEIESVGRLFKRTEHLGECGYGPPNLFWIEEPSFQN